MKAFLLTIIAVCLLGTQAMAQSVPFEGTPSAIPPIKSPSNVIWTSNQWRTAWSSKLDLNAKDSVSPLAYGAVGNGVADDTSAMQAALNAATTAGLPLIIDGAHKYLISTGLTSSTGVPVIHGVTGSLGVYTASCPSGIVVNSNITALTLTGPSARVDHVCFQMANSPGARTAGAAIALGATGSTQQGHAEIVSNTIINSYNGIVVGGATNGTTQTNSNLISNNIIINHSNIGITNGRDSTNASTVGTTFRDNQIFCGSASANATGLSIYDGSVRYYGSDGGPYNCKYGLVLIPKNLQLALILGDDVLGDTSLSAGLLISPATGGKVIYARFVGAWATSDPAGTTGSSVVLSGAGTILDVMFNGFLVHSSAGQTVPIIDIQNGSNITITGSHIVADGGGTTSGPGIRVGAAADHVVISGNKIGSFNGTLTTGLLLQSGNNDTTIIGNDFDSTNGVTVAPGANAFTITGNNFALSSTPINYSPNSETAVINNNNAVETIFRTVASAATITAPVNPNFTITGTTAVTTINGAWSSRQITMIPTSVAGLTFNTGGNICNSVTVTQNVPVLGLYDGAAACWRLK